MKGSYEVADRRDRRAIAEFLKREGQFLLPMVELVEGAGLAIDEVIEVLGRATIEAVLEMSAEGVAGPKQAGRADASIVSRLTADLLRTWWWSTWTVSSSARTTSLRP